MSTRIKLQRLERKHCPEYNIIVASTHKAKRRAVMPIEVLGHYRPNPIFDKESEKMMKKCELDFDRCKYWISVGSDISYPVFKLFDKAGLGAFGKGARKYHYLKKADPANGQIEREAKKYVQKLDLEKWRKEFAA